MLAPVQTRSQKRTYQNDRAKKAKTTAMKMMSLISTSPYLSFLLFPLASVNSLSVEIDPDGCVEEMIAAPGPGIIDRVANITRHSRVWLEVEAGRKVSARMLAGFLLLSIVRMK